MEFLTETHIQKLADVLAAVHNEHSFERVIRRYEAQHFVEGETLTQHIETALRNSQGTTEGLRLLAELASEAPAGSSQAGELERALQGTPFLVEGHGESGTQLLLKLGVEAEEFIQEQRSFIEEHAPREVVEALRGARRNLTDGEQAEAAGAARRALEKLTRVDRFSQALDELKGHGLLQKDPDDGPTRNGGWDALYVAYGYASSLYHTTADEGDPSRPQVEYALAMVYASVYRLVQVLLQADQEGIALARWVPLER